MALHTQTAFDAAKHALATAGVTTRIMGAIVGVVMPAVVLLALVGCVGVLTILLP